MTNQVKLIIGVIIFGLIGSAGLYVKSLNDQVIKCKANTSIQKTRYEKEIKSYDAAILDITAYYEGRVKDVTKFKRRDNETDCQASKRFLDSASY